MPGKICHFHTDEFIDGVRQSDGSYAYSCDLTKGHPGEQPWQWLEVPAPPGLAGVGGLAEELRLDVELPLALAALGKGWFEYGLVEREYARRQPGDFAVMVKRWGHTAVAPSQYTASSYIAGTLGALSRAGVIAFHPGYGTGRWSYNTDISWWSSDPAADWESRTAWSDAVPEGEDADDSACKAYVPGA